MAESDTEGDLILTGDNHTSIIQRLLYKDELNLKYCYLEGLSLEVLPEDFFQHLPHLEWLDLRNNKLSEIPKSISNHEHLKTLLLQNNKLSHLPIYLGTVKQLQNLQLRGNPIIFPKKHILRQGTTHVLHFLNELCEGREFKETVKNTSIKATGSKTTFWESSDRIFKFQVKSAQEKCKIGERCERSIWKRNSERYVEPVFVCREIQDMKIRDAIFKEQLLQKKKELLGKREKMLQNKKSLEALKHWRRGYEEDQSNNTHIYYALNLSNLPYDTNLEFVKILTRAEIEKDLPDKYVKNIQRVRSSRSNKMKSTQKKEEAGTKIAELLQTLEEGNSEFVDLTPRSRKINTNNEINKLTKLQKEIMKLKIAHGGI